MTTKPQTARNLVLRFFLKSEGKIGLFFRHFRKSATGGQALIFAQLNSIFSKLLSLLFKEPRCKAVLALRPGLLHESRAPWEWSPGNQEAHGKSTVTWRTWQCQTYCATALDFLLYLQCCGSASLPITARIHNGRKFGRKSAGSLVSTDWTTCTLVFRSVLWGCVCSWWEHFICSDCRDTWKSVTDFGDLVFFTDTGSTVLLCVAFNSIQFIGSITYKDLHNERVRPKPVA